MYTLLKELVLAGASVTMATNPLPPALAATQDRPDTTTVTVQNSRSVRVTVYLEQGDFDLRLGVVGPDTVATLHLPESIVRDGRAIQIFAHPEGGFDLATQTLSVTPGEHLGLVVPSGAQMPPLAGPRVPDPNPGDPATTLMVQNDRDRDVVVFVEQGEFDTRLGSVPAHRTATLRIPDWLADQESIEVFVHPEGGFDLATERMRLHRGEHLHLVVPKS